MTSYPGLPERHRALVTAFKDALIGKLRENGADANYDVRFEEIDYAHNAAAEKLGKNAGSKRRADNWVNVQKGWAESKKLCLVFAQAQDVLGEDDIAACVPEEIKPDGTVFSRYEMEKNGLTPLTEYLVPKEIRDIGLY